MSSTVDYDYPCPKCGKSAYYEQDNKTCEVFIQCKHCGFSNAQENTTEDYRQS
jgi:predicted RNA-binding Zn-ribbon protein involved in translation (DUF1610 family)